MSIHALQPHVGNQQSTQKQERVDSHDSVDYDNWTPLSDWLRRKENVSNGVSAWNVFQDTMSLILLTFMCKLVIPIQLY